MSVSSIPPMGIGAVILFLRILAIRADPGPFASDIFLPNYARSFSQLIGLPGKAFLFPSTSKPVVKRVTEELTQLRNEEEAPGFHLGSELESRSLTGYPDLSPLFNQPVAMSDLLNRAPTGRLYAANRSLLPSGQQRAFPPAAVPAPRSGVSLPTFNLGDYSNPFFRPIYARPPAPPARKDTTVKQQTSACPCSCGQDNSSATTAPPVILLAKTETAAVLLRPTVQLETVISVHTSAGTVTPPISEKRTVSLEPFPVSVKLTTLPAVTQTPASSIDNLVLEAFNATRSGDLDFKDVNAITDSGKDVPGGDDKEDDVFNEREGGEATSGSTTLVTEEPSNGPVAVLAPTTAAPPGDRIGKKVPDIGTYPESLPYNKPVNLAVGKSPSRRFNSLLDLSMRRGGRQPADFT